MIAAFRAWLCQSLLDELETRHDRELKVAQAQGYAEGHVVGWDKGRAFGQLEGQHMTIAELQRIQAERRAEGCEVLPADIERARKGILH